jgi:hypothetical protein
MFDLFKSNTGVDLIKESGNLSTISSNASNTMISAAFDTINFTGLAQSSSNSSFTQMGSTITFTPKISGKHKFDIYFDQNSSGAEGGRGYKYAIVNGDNTQSPYGITLAGQIAGTSFDPSDSTQVAQLYLHEPEDNIQVGVDIIETGTGTILDQAYTGGKGAMFWMDFFLTASVYLTAGTSYSMKFYYVNYTESNPNTMDITVGYNVYTVAP